MSFLAWLTAWAARPVADAVQAVAALWDAMRRLWSILATLFRRVARITGRTGAAAAALARAIRHVIPHVVTVLWWLATVYIPALTRTAYTSAITWTRRELTTLLARVGAQLMALRTLISAARAALSVALDKVRRWALTEIATVWRTVLAVRDIVYALLRDPRRLVTWILPVLWGPLWRYIESRSVSIGRWVLRRAVAAALGMAHLVEEVIARVI